ncbi:Alpha/Beta hydrolase protein [Polychytrium aggregatum]|uniref:Alpha/Beta hydrolase protein n=1 Tax=Polychytrium aggregatum TaxID=110093 RepID=UPI0022FE6C55|nr:Alpha/Beta hydrolase protein [Polychytrium aggregatum]KAI9204983.1 Alpha/Beta hydrolase protein [Polychytrium aggregatum]
MTSLPSTLALALASLRSSWSTALSASPSIAAHVLPPRPLAKSSSSSPDPKPGPKPDPKPGPSPNPDPALAAAASPEDNPDRQLDQTLASQIPSSPPPSSAPSAPSPPSRTPPPSAKYPWAHEGFISHAHYRVPKYPIVLCHAYIDHSAFPPAAGLRIRARSVVSSNRAMEQKDASVNHRPALVVTSLSVHPSGPSGLFGFDKLGPESIPFLQIRYWRGIADALHDLGCEVHITRVPTVGAIRNRAHELKRFLETNMNGRRVNLIAHSMGGLDCRYLITHLPSTQYSVESLTTIATPHRGSAFMDWCRDSFGVGAHDPIPPDCAVSEALFGVKLPGDVSSSYTSPDALCQDTLQPNHSLVDAKLVVSATTHPVIKYIMSPLDAPAFGNLTRDYCRIFNLATPDRDSVRYFSYAAVTNVSKLAPLYFSHQILNKMEGVNDGLVSLDSAKWGEFMGAVDCDHWELIPPKIRGLSSSFGIKRGTAFNSIEFYLQVVSNLAENEC